MCQAGLALYSPVAQRLHCVCEVVQNLTKSTTDLSGFVLQEEFWGSQTSHFPLATAVRERGHRWHFDGSTKGSALERCMIARS